MPELNDLKDALPRKNRFLTIVFLVVFIGMTAALVYLLSVINNRRFFIEYDKGYLVFKRGMFLPIGKKDFVPDDPELRSVFLPVKIPDGQDITEREFPDQLEMERCFFGLLMKWADKRIHSENPEEFAQGTNYIERLSMLKASSEELRKLGNLRGDMLFREGKKYYDNAVIQLKNAQRKFSESEQLGPGKFADGEKYLKTTNQILSVIDGKATVLFPDDFEVLKKRIFSEIVQAPPVDGGVYDGGVADGGK